MEEEGGRTEGGRSSTKCGAGMESFDGGQGGEGRGGGMRPKRTRFRCKDEDVGVVGSGRERGTTE